MDPVLKYAGSKRWAVERLGRLYDRRRRLVEPFVGSMAVALGLQPDRALLCDSNPHLINFHRRVRDPRPFTVSMINDERFYYAQRDVFNALVKLPAGACSDEAAEIFFYLNRTAFNGLVRFNRRGEFNVPFGKYTEINYRRDFSEYATAMSGWDIRCQDFAVTLAEAEVGDFVYADPVYDGTFDDYDGKGFTWERQIELAETLSQHFGPVIASNAATDRVLSLYRALGFDIELVEVRRSIAANGDRSRAMEMFATKNAVDLTVRSE